MARMHSGRHGRSGSTKPAKKVMPTWSRYKAKELEMLVIKLAREGKTASVIGIALRDMYGVVDVKLITGKSVTQILDEKKLRGKVPEDLAALIKKRMMIAKHLEDNKQDQPAVRGLRLTDSKINRLIKYYKRTEKLPLDWKFDASKSSMLIQ